ncbi:hypothetical protein 101117BS1_283 [Escherichia phage vB_EcoM-101117BS1]|nr:hypothetical protein 101117BS1_283 [Escherichia phage vB_EcoM-101117BS1]
MVYKLARLWYSNLVKCQGEENESFVCCVCDDSI